MENSTSSSTSSGATTVSGSNSNATIKNAAIKIEGLISIGYTYWLSYIKGRMKCLLIAGTIAAEIFIPLLIGLMFGLINGIFYLPISESLYWIISILSMIAGHFLVCFKYHLFEVIHLRLVFSSLRVVIIGWAACLGLWVVIDVLATNDLKSAKLQTTLWWLSSLGVILVERICISLFLSKSRISHYFKPQVVVLGLGVPLHIPSDHFLRSTLLDVRVLKSFPEPNVISSTAQLDLSEFLEYVRGRPVDEVIVVDGSSSPSHLEAICDALSGLPVTVRLLDITEGENSQFHPKPTRTQTAFKVQTSIEVVSRPLNDTQRVLKRIEDLSLALLTLIVLLPLMGVIALLIRLETKGPVLFCQTRLGLGNQHYTVFKFRTMHVKQCDSSGVQATVQNDSRVTKVGAILRKNSLDELPQLFNVLIGHMSIVGPRPHPVNMRVGKTPYDEVVAGYAARHRVKTGITGWAQVNCFRGEVKDIEHAIGRVEHDLWYIDHHSLSLDVKIIFLTFWHLLTTRQAY